MRSKSQLSIHMQLFVLVVILVRLLVPSLFLVLTQETKSCLVDVLAIVMYRLALCLVPVVTLTRTFLVRTVLCVRLLKCLALRCLRQIIGKLPCRVVVTIPKLLLVLKSVDRVNILLLVRGNPLMVTIRLTTIRLARNSPGTSTSA